MFILIVISANAYTLRLIKQNKIQESYRFDSDTAAAVLISYVVLNAWFTWRAVKGT